jgi:hypothetical protein
MANTLGLFWEWASAFDTHHPLPSSRAKWRDPSLPTIKHRTRHPAPNQTPGAAVHRRLPRWPAPFHHHALRRGDPSVPRMTMGTANSSPPRLLRTIRSETRRVEELRRSCRGVDSGETPETPLHAATLPNLGMWMESPKLPEAWIRCRRSTRSSPIPVDNPPGYPRNIPGFPSVRTPRCPHYAQLIPNRPKVIHNSTLFSGT